MKKNAKKVQIALVLACVTVLTGVVSRQLDAADMPAARQKYLVIGSGGPGFASPEETLAVLEKGILPTFDALLKLETDRRILAGGLPLGDRSFVFILEASSNEEADQILREIPAWGVLKWEVKPLQSFEGRAKKERSVLAELKKRLQ
jgi:hypothetical protein